MTSIVIYAIIIDIESKQLANMATFKKEAETMKLTYKTNKQYWAIKKELIAKGYKLTSDCYWYQTFQKDNKKIELERE